MRKSKEERRAGVRRSKAVDVGVEGLVSLLDIRLGPDNIPYVSHCHELWSEEVHVNAVVGRQAQPVGVVG